MHSRSPQLLRLLSAIAAVGIPSASLHAGEPAPAATTADKSEYHLFNRTPRELLREMSTDRPDKTESAYTVEAGWMQVEMDLVSFSYDRHNSERSHTRLESWSFVSTNLKFGLWNNVDFQIVFEPYTTARTVDHGVVSRSQGFGDLTFRTKVNVWGNDGGSTALALMPFVKVPTNQDDLGNHAVEGGLIVPLAVELPGGFGLGLMTEVDINENGGNDDYHAEWVNTITVSHDLTDHLDMYVEFFSAVSSEDKAPWVGTVDLGFSYAVNEDIHLDAGVNIGLTRSADDVNPFVGLSWRF